MEGRMEEKRGWTEVQKGGGRRMRSSLMCRTRMLVRMLVRKPGVREVCSLFAVVVAVAVIIVWAS